MTANVDVEAISVGVGFDVTKSRTKRMTGEYQVPKGKYGTLKAYPLYANYSFNVYIVDSSWYRGKGAAKKVIGYCYTHSVK
ncbi:hypothetical protein T261_4740 [Streptomyces lydicus]|nr:hypothetical protein T261_4740 [Streptomyces lydicus]